MNNDYELIKIKEKINEVKNGIKEEYITPFMPLNYQFEIENLLRKLNIPYYYLNKGERKVAFISYNLREVKDEITILKVNTKESLRHNEIMGAVLNLGIKREVVGNIYALDINLIEVLSHMKDYILDNLHYVSKNKVTLEVYNGKVPEIKLETKKVITSSLRLDNVVGAVFNMSRELAKMAIINKDVQLNFKNDLKVDQKIPFNCYLSCKKKGKVYITESVGKTKKDNIILEVNYF